MEEIRRPCRQGPRDSQLFHIDPYSNPLVYVIVALEDVTEEKGPFIYLPESVSQEAARKLNYWETGKPYRLADEEVYSVVKKEDVGVMTCRKGTVLFIDPSRCLHYGSRDSEEPRYLAMFGLVSPCRTDFSESFIPPNVYSAKENDSRLRRLVIEKFAPVT